VLLVLLIVIPVLIMLFLRLSVAPLVQELAKARVDNRASYVINEAVETLLREDQINYEDIILLEKDINGSVTALKTNMSEINHLKTQILSVIDVMLLDLDVNEIGLPLGSVILPELFSGTGPKLPVRVMSISRSDAEFRNEFKEAGINQSLQQIMMDVIITMTILTPVGTETVTTVSQIVVAETVIVGSVPDSYVNFDG
jgi:sporulation protein YunB